MPRSVSEADVIDIAALVAELTPTPAPRARAWVELLLEDHDPHRVRRCVVDACREHDRVSLATLTRALASGAGSRYDSPEEAEAARAHAAECRAQSEDSRRWHAAASAHPGTGKQRARYANELVGELRRPSDVARERQEQASRPRSAPRATPGRVAMRRAPEGPSRVADTLPDWAVAE